jgi:dihydroxyacetone kinase
METAESHLGAIDAVAGDGDHGIGMVKGSAAAAKAARELAEQGGGALTVLVGAGDRWAEASGGASGALWGAALTAAGNVLGNDRGADLATQFEAVKAFVSAIERLGGASLGDKTMLDAQLAFASAFETGLQKGGSATEIWEEAARAAEDAATNTAQLEPKLGRARVLSQRSIGWPDPGAVSFGIIATTAAEAVRSGGEG